MCYKCKNIGPCLIEDSRTTIYHNTDDTVKKLKAELAHQIRLRDLMESDRDNFERMYYDKVGQIINLRKEIKVLKEYIRNER